jgi:hypothetical protein
MRFLLKPNGYAVHNIGERVTPAVMSERGELVQHEVREAISIPGKGVECEVDDKQEELFLPKDGKLLLSPAGYEAVRKKFGAQLVCEPIGGLSGEGAAKKIAELEAANLSLKDAASAEKSRADTADARVADLEAQIAAASKPAKK